MFQFFRNWRDRRIIQRSTITALQWDKAFASLPLLAGMSESEKHRLRELAILFIHRKVFVGAHDVVVNESMALIIALQACLPVLNLGIDCYDGWTSVIVYPAGFAPRRIYTDEYGVEHHVQDNLVGESWLRGPVILSWDDTEHAGIIDGSNLVIHEFAHKLDMQNGAANGYPPLHADMQHSAWVESFTAGFEDFQHKCESGKYLGIDCYAASSPAEFFAVLSEVFFEKPALLKKHYAAIYEQLHQYYRQDLIARFH